MEEGKGPELSGEFHGPVAVNGGEAVDLRGAQGVVYKPNILNGVDQVDPVLRLAELESESHARCVARWQAMGISRAKAIEMSGNSSIGIPSPDMLPSEEKPVVVLVGDFGAGKSLIAERLFQGAILRLRRDENASLPVFLKAQFVVDKLHESVIMAACEIGNPHVQGATVVIDGADEAGISAAARLLNEARVLVGSLPRTTVVITSRPIPVFFENEESIRLPGLSEDEIGRLISEFAERDISVGMMLGWPESVTKSIDRPLFSILLGIYLREQEVRVPRSTANLLTFLIERSLGEVAENLVIVEEVLQRLAVLSIDWAGPIPTAEIGLSRIEKQKILDSRLVVEQSKHLSFALPIFTQWFAAQSLANGMLTAEELASDPGRLERWRYPLVVFVGSCGHDQVSSVLEVLVRTHPGFVANVVKDSIAEWGIPETVSLPPWHECGKRLRSAMQAWIEGVRPLDRLIAPVKADGRLTSLGLRVRQPRIETSWYRGVENFPDILELPHDIAVFSKSDSMVNWPTVRLYTPGDHPAWAWRQTLGELVEGLSQRLKARSLPVLGGPLFSETVWCAMLKVTNRGEYHPGPIPLDEIEQYLSQFRPQTGRIVMDKWSFDIGELCSLVDQWRESGVTELISPWPDQDIQIRRSCRVWEPYSQEQMLARIKVVYANAFEGYRSLVNTWFPNLANRLQMAIKMPLRLVGEVSFGSGMGLGSPHMKYFFEPLPYGSQNDIDVRVAKSSGRMDSRELFDSMWRQWRALRPEFSDWLVVAITTSVLRIFGPTPVTELVYSWLWNDLQQLGWVEGFLG